MTTTELTSILLWNAGRGYRELDSEKIPTEVSGDGLETLNDIYAQVRDIRRQCQQLDELLPQLKAKHEKEYQTEVRKLADQFLNP